GARPVEEAWRQAGRHDRRRGIRQLVHRRPSGGRRANLDQTALLMTERRLTAFEKMWLTRTDRRAFLLGGLALVGAGALTRVQARPRWTESPFSLGIASGDPEHDSVVLWTRLAPDPLNGGGMREPVEVRWEVAEDDS